MKLAATALGCACLFLIAAFLGLGSSPGTTPGDPATIVIAGGPAASATGQPSSPGSFVPVGRDVQSVSLAQLEAPPGGTALAAGPSVASPALPQLAILPGQVLATSPAATAPTAPATAAVPLTPATPSAPPVPIVIPNLALPLPTSLPPILGPTSSVLPTPSPSPAPNLLNRLLGTL